MRRSFKKLVFRLRSLTKILVLSLISFKCLLKTRKVKPSNNLKLNCKTTSQRQGRLMRLRNIIRLWLLQIRSALCILLIYSNVFQPPTSKPLVHSTNANCGLLILECAKLTSKICFCFNWYEAVGRRGANQIRSCI